MNVIKHSDTFESRVPCWVFEEDVSFRSLRFLTGHTPLRHDQSPRHHTVLIVSNTKYLSDETGADSIPSNTQFEGQKLTQVINSTHVNKKYLPDVILPDNFVAIPDIEEAVKDATALVFVMPHQCKSLLALIELSWPGLLS